ncbi:uncharacterized protein ACO6RY_13596 [Pungitius sinensis]
MSLVSLGNFTSCLVLSSPVIVCCVDDCFHLLSNHLLTPVWIIQMCLPFGINRLWEIKEAAEKVQKHEINRYEEIEFEVRVNNCVTADVSGSVSHTRRFRKRKGREP